MPTVREDTFGRESVAELMRRLDPQYRVEGVNDDGEVSPNWGKVEKLAAAMRAGTFDYDRSPVTVVGHPAHPDRWVFDGNHRVLGADRAGIDSLPVHYTMRPLG